MMTTTTATAAVVSTFADDGWRTQQDIDRRRRIDQASRTANGLPCTIGGRVAAKHGTKMGLVKNSGVSRELADWFYRSKFDFGNVDAFVLHLAINSVKSAMGLSGDRQIEWLSRSTIWTVLCINGGEGDSVEFPSIEIAIEFSGRGSGDVDQWLEAALIFGTKLNQSRIGYLGMPEDYEVAAMPPQGSGIVEGVGRWVLAMYELRNGPWAWQEPELSWACIDPVQTSHDLIDALMLATLDKTHEARQLPTVQKHNPPTRSAIASAMKCEVSAEKQVTGREANTYREALRVLTGQELAIANAIIESGFSMTYRHIAGIEGAGIDGAFRDDEIATEPAARRKIMRINQSWKLASIPLNLKPLRRSGPLVIIENNSEKSATVT